jgi:alpha-L-rhamnosidase
MKNRIGAIFFELASAGSALGNIGILVIILLTAIGSYAQQAPLSPTNLRVNYSTEPLGIEDAFPRFSWLVNDNDRGEIQTAYEIIVASSESDINNNVGNIWSSGKVNSSQQNGVVYAGQALLGLSRYYWKVRTYDKDGMVGAWSTASWFETAMVHESDWQATYIRGNFNLLRKEFSLNPGKTIQRARAYVSGQGWFEFRLNGQKVGDHVLDPLPTGGYSLYVTFDITEYLIAGTTNAAGLMLGTHAAEKLALCQIVVWYTDGTTQTIGSDNSWKSLLGGPITHAHIFDGERYDAREELPGWDLPGYNDAEWNVAPGWAIVNGVLNINEGSETLIKNGRNWSDYTFQTDFNITNICIGAVFRATDVHNLYMWQINPGNPGYIRPHIKKEGAYSVLPTIILPMAINTHTWYTLKIVTNGQNIKTYINNQLVSDINDNSHGLGSIGFRNGANEYAQADNSIVTDASNTLFQDDYSDGFAQWGSDITNVKSQLEPIKIIEEISPVSMTEPRPGVYVFDVGKNISGWVELKVQGNAGTTVTLKFGERQYADGSLDNSSNTNGFPAEQLDTYTLKGSGGIETWEPRFTYHGFRYVEVTGFPGTPTLNSIKAKFIASHVNTYESTFSSDNTVLNQIYEAYRITQLDNLTGIPTDCNQRAERAGWLADAAVTSESALLYFDASRFYEKFTNDLLAGEQPSGSAGVLIGGGQEEIVWGSASITIPWDLYKNNGDISILQKVFERSKRFVAFITDRPETQNNLVELPAFPEGHGSGLVSWNDWLSVTGAHNNPSNTYIGSIYYYHCANIVAQMAQALNNDSDYAHYSALANDIKNAINSRFLMDNSYYDNNAQSANALALFMGIVPDSHKAAVAQSLANDIEARDDHLSTGAIGTFALMDALSSNDKADIAFTLASTTSYPSWGYMLNQPNSPGTFWEHWDNQDMSKNHPFMAGSVSSWLFYHVAGIQSAQPGFEEIILKPSVAMQLNHASGVVNSVRGEITSNWSKTDDDFNWLVRIPANIKGTLYIPTLERGSNVAIYEGESLVWNTETADTVDGLSYLKTEDDFIVWNIGSGTYNFIVTDISNIPSLTSYISVNANPWDASGIGKVNVGGNIWIRPQPAEVPGWTWTGPNGFTHSGPDFRLDNIQAHHSGVYIGVYRDPTGKTAKTQYWITVQEEPTSLIQDKPPIPKKMSKMAVYNLLGQKLRGVR